MKELTTQQLKQVRGGGYGQFLKKMGRHVGRTIGYIECQLHKKRGSKDRDLPRFGSRPHFG